MIVTRRQLAATLALLALDVPSAPAADDGGRYDIEVIVFRGNNGSQIGRAHV